MLWKEGGCAFGLLWYGGERGGAVGKTGVGFTYDILFGSLRCGSPPRRSTILAFQLFKFLLRNRLSSLNPGLLGDSKRGEKGIERSKVARGEGASLGTRQEEEEEEEEEAWVVGKKEGGLLLLSFSLSQI